MATGSYYIYARIVRDALQLERFLKTHMGDPFVPSALDASGISIYTSEPAISASTQAAIQAYLNKYPDPAPSSRGPKATIVMDVKRGGTGRSVIPAGAILFGQDLSPLSSDTKFKYDNATKSLTVSAISGSPTSPTSYTNKGYVDSLSYLSTGSGLTLSGQGYITRALSESLFEPTFAVSPALVKSNGVLSLAANQLTILTVGTLSGLALSGALTSASTFTSTSATAATTTTTGALTFPNGGGISTAGAIYGGSMFVGTNAVATQAWSNSNLESRLSISTGLLRSGNVITVNPTQSLAALTLTEGTASTFVSTGTLILSGASGLSVGGTIYASSMFIGTAPVATQPWATNYFEPLLSPGSGITKNNNVLSFSQNQSLAALTLPGGTASTSTTTGTLVLSGNSGLGVQGAVYAGAVIVGTNAVATQLWSRSVFEPLLSISTGLLRSGNVITVNPNQSLTGLTLTGPLTSSSTVTLTGTTASSSTTTGALIVPSLDCSGNLYAGNLFAGTAQVATQPWVTGFGYLTASIATATYEPIVNFSTGLLRSGNVITVNPSQSLSGLTMTGPMTSSSTVALGGTTASTSTTTGALTVPSLGCSGSLYAGSLFVGTAPVATQAFVSQNYDPLSTFTTGVTRSAANVVTVNSTLGHVTSVGTLTALSLSGPLTSSSTFSSTSTTAATSTTTGALTFPNGGGVSTTGALYAGSLFVGTSAVATQAFVGATYEPILSISTGLLRSGNLFHDCLDWHDVFHFQTTGALTVPSLGCAGSLYAASLFVGTAPVATQAFVSQNYDPLSTSTTGVTRSATNVVTVNAALNHAGSLFVGTNAVATQAFTAATYEPILNISTGLLRSGNVITVNPNLLLAGLSLTGTTDSTALGVGCLVLQGGLSNAKNITTASLTLASGMSLTAFSGGSWMNLPTTGPSGIGTGGAGANCFIGYCQSAGHWFTNASPGDVAYRNNAGRILWGNTGGDASMALSGDNLGIGTATPTSRLDVNGNANVSGTINVGTINGTASTMGGPVIMMSDGYDAPATQHTISFLSATQTGSGYIFVYVRNANGSTVGTMLVGFYKPASGNMQAATSITQTKATLLTLSAAPSGNNVVVTTSAGCSIAYTINLGS
ncbi:hypothetical protein HDV00_006570 [Rhizophlyctis rosea]|nr:hypothetical protein HDV00_006570 [Rhizophlyctis rosea]